MYNYINLSILYMCLLLNYTFFSDIMLKTVFKHIWIICFCTQDTIQQNIFLSDLCCLRHHAYAIFRRFPGSPGTYIVPMLRSIPYKKKKRFTHRFLSKYALTFFHRKFPYCWKKQIPAVRRKGNDLSSDCKKEISFFLFAWLVQI